MLTTCLKNGFPSNASAFRQPMQGKSCTASVNVKQQFLVFEAEITQKSLQSTLPVTRPIGAKDKSLSFNGRACVTERSKHGDSRTPQLPGKFFR